MICSDLSNTNEFYQVNLPERTYSSRKFKLKKKLKLEELKDLDSKDIVFYQDSAHPHMSEFRKIEELNSFVPGGMYVHICIKSSTIYIFISFKMKVATSF